LYNVYYPEDTAKEPIGIVFHKDKFYQFFHSSTTGNPYLGALLKEANQYKFQDDVLTKDEEDKGCHRRTRDCPGGELGLTNYGRRCTEKGGVVGCHLGRWINCLHLGP